MSLAHVTCKISIRGSYDLFWTDYLGDMVLRAEVEAGEIRTTTLFGEPSRSGRIHWDDQLARRSWILPSPSVNIHQVDGEE